MTSENVQKETLTISRIEAAEIEVDLQRFEITPVLVNYSLRTVVLKFDDYWLLSDRR